MLLPGHVAGDLKQREQQQQIAARIGQLRLQVATQLLAPLVAYEYGDAQDTALAAAERDDELYGTVENREQPKKIEFNINLSLPVHVAIQAADLLLAGLGVVTQTQGES